MLCGTTTIGVNCGDGANCENRAQPTIEEGFILKKIGFIGAGQMAKSLAVGISSANSEDIELLIADPNDEACASLIAGVGSSVSVTRAANNQELVLNSDLVFLAVKPQVLPAAIVGNDFSRRPLVISIVAGFSIVQLERMLGIDRIIRVMPNTPCLIGQGVSAISPGEKVNVNDVDLVSKFLATLGMVVSVEERLLDSVTGLSGSGPAYVFTFIEALIDGAVLTGMPRGTARELALQTVIGAANMLKQTGEHPAVLRDRVTSPGGTTIEALKTLEESSFRDTVMSAVVAAAMRSRELGE